MPPGNRWVLAAFLGGLAMVVLAYAAFDVWLAWLRPDAELTISWSMALMSRDPLLVFAVGHATGGLLWGLAAHFWAAQPTPAMWDELQRLRAEHAAREPPGGD